jgi:hypothetical protein
MQTTSKHPSQPKRRSLHLLPAALTAAAMLAMSACGGGDETTAHDDAALEKSAKYTVGGTVSGLGAEDTLSATLDFVNFDVLSAGTFTLTQKLSKGAAYNVGFFPPTGYACTIANGSGMIDKDNVTNVAINCVPQQPIVLKYQVSGLPAGASVTLNAFGFPLATVTVNGTYDFPVTFLPGDQYIFGITTQTPGAGCGVPADDQFGFLQPQPNPRILHVNCGTATPG